MGFILSRRDEILEEMDLHGQKERKKKNWIWLQQSLKEANNFDKEEEKGRVEEDNGGGKYNNILIVNLGYKKGCCSFGLCIQFCEETKLRAWVILRN